MPRRRGPRRRLGRGRRGRRQRPHASRRRCRSSRYVELGGRLEGLPQCVYDPAADALVEPRAVDPERSGRGGRRACSRTRAASKRSARRRAQHVLAQPISTAHVRDVMAVIDGSCQAHRSSCAGRGSRHDGRALSAEPRRTQRRRPVARDAVARPASAGVPAVIACERGALKFWLRTGVRARRRYRARTSSGSAAQGAVRRRPRAVRCPSAELVFVHNLATEASGTCRAPTAAPAVAARARVFPRARTRTPPSSRTRSSCRRRCTAALRPRARARRRSLSRAIRSRRYHAAARSRAARRRAPRARRR